MELTKLVSNLLDCQEIEEFKELFDLDLGNVPTYMTPFQIKHFVLNKREFPTDFAQLCQAKLELFQRIHVLYDLYYDYRKAKAEIELAEAEIEELGQQEGKKARAQIKLQEIEIDRRLWQLVSIKKKALDILQEAMSFFRAYQQYRKLEELSPEALAKLEEKTWHIKSTYYRELTERYGLTPDGFLKLPHEEGKLLNKGK